MCVWTYSSLNNPNNAVSIPLDTSKNIYRESREFKILTWACDTEYHSKVRLYLPIFQKPGVKTKSSTMLTSYTDCCLQVHREVDVILGVINLEQCRIMQFNYSRITEAIGLLLSVLKCLPVPYMYHPINWQAIQTACRLYTLRIS